jgi:hypothetical protein
MKFADWCVPVKISSSSEYCARQALQFQDVIVVRKIPSGTGMSHN